MAPELDTWWWDLVTFIAFAGSFFLLWEQWIRPMSWHNEDDDQKDTDLNDEKKRPDELEPEE